MDDFFYDPRNPEKDFDYWFIKYRHEILKNFRKGQIALELGCATGISTYFLSKIFGQVIVVEINEENIKIARNFLASKGVDMSHITFIKANWLDIEMYLEERRKFSDIVWLGGAEYLEFGEAKKFLSKIKNYLLHGGRIHLSVSNRRSLHRRIGFYMGQLRSLDEFSQRDILTGGKKWLGDIHRIYELLDFFNIIHIEPYFLKLLPNEKMKELWRENPNIVDALFRLGRELPDYCAEIYVCASPSVQYER